MSGDAKHKNQSWHRALWDGDEDSIATPRPRADPRAELSWADIIGYRVVCGMCVGRSCDLSRVPASLCCSGSAAEHGKGFVAWLRATKTKKKRIENEMKTEIKNWSYTWAEQGKQICAMATPSKPGQEILYQLVPLASALINNDLISGDLFLCALQQKQNEKERLTTVRRRLNTLYCSYRNFDRLCEVRRVEDRWRLSLIIMIYNIYFIEP